jgi:hypothetical protein
VLYVVKAMHKFDTWLVVNETPNKRRPLERSYIIMFRTTKGFPPTAEKGLYHAVQVKAHSSVRTVYVSVAVILSSSYLKTLLISLTLVSSNGRTVDESTAKHA